MGATMKHFLRIAVLLALFAFPSGVDAAARFAVCTVTCTWDASSTAMWSATTGGATGASVPVAADTVTLDGATCVGGVTCTITVNTNPTITSLTMGACTASTTGCILDFSANNNNISMGTFSGTGTGARTLNMGSGTWTISSNAGTVWNTTTVTSFTFNPNTSTLLFSSGATSSGRTFSSAALTYSTVSIAANSNIGSFTFNEGGSTLGALLVAAPNNILFTASSTRTITNAFSINGASLSSVISFMGTTPSATPATISIATGTPSFTYTVFREMTFSGGATFTATNSIDLGQNIGISITAPTTGSGGRIIGG